MWRPEDTSLLLVFCQEPSSDQDEPPSKARRDSLQITGPYLPTCPGHQRQEENEGPSPLEETEEAEQPGTVGSWTALEAKKGQCGETGRTPGKSKCC